MRNEPVTVKDNLLCKELVSAIAEKRKKQGCVVSYKVKDVLVNLLIQWSSLETLAQEYHDLIFLHPVLVQH